MYATELGNMNKRDARAKKEEAFLRHQMALAKWRATNLPHVFVEVENVENGITSELGYPRYLKESELSSEAIQQLDNLDIKVPGSGLERVVGSDKSGALIYPERHKNLTPKRFTAKGQVAFRNFLAGWFQLFHGSYQDEFLSCENAGLLKIWGAMNSMGPDHESITWQKCYRDAYYAIIIGESASIYIEATELPQAPGYHIMSKDGKMLISPVTLPPLQESVLSVTESRQWSTP